MRQIGGENDDPLKRIQEEINEVKQRELELRNQLRYDSLHKQQSLKDQQQQPGDDSGISTTSSSPVNGTSANRALDLDTSSATSADRRPHRFVDHNSQQQPTPRKAVPATTTQTTTGESTKPKKQPISNPTYVRSTSAAAFVFAPRNPKPAVPIEYYIPPQPAKSKITSTTAKKSQRNETMLTRTVSTPQLFQSFQPKVPSRSFMQRFIETRGKINPNSIVAKSPSIDHGPPTSNGSIYISPTAQIAPPVRDADGKLLRKGFVPVEEKIQKELREMRHREVELKIQRQKSLQYDSNHNLVQEESKEDESETYNSLEYEDSGFKLRNSKSISELSDFSPRNSPSPQFDNHYQQPQRYKAQQLSYAPRPKLRPALSLAQLCDLDPSDEVVSSNRLIAQFECLIQKKQAV